jgi:hypothetical protein
MLASAAAATARSSMRTGVSSLNLAGNIVTGYAEKNGLVSADTAKRIKEGSSRATTYINSSINKENWDKAANAGKKSIEFAKTAYKDPSAAAGIAANKATEVGKSAYNAATASVSSATAATLAQRQRQRQRQRQSKKLRQRQSRRQKQKQSRRQRQSRKLRQSRRQKH